MIDSLVLNKYKIVRKAKTINNIPVYVGESDGEYFLIKCWHYTGNSPEDIHQALWKQELRTLQLIQVRVTSLNSILVLRDHGVDSKNKCLVTVLEHTESPQCEFRTLGEIYEGRSIFDPPQESCVLNFREDAARTTLWTGISNIATAIETLHIQNIIHCRIGFDAIYADNTGMPDRWRLSGFESSFRFDQLLQDNVLQIDVTESVSFSYDWNLFGRIIATLLLGCDYRAKEAELKTALEFNRYNISKIEIAFIRLLLGLAEGAPLSAAEDVISMISDIKHALARGSSGSYRLALLYSNNARWIPRFSPDVPNFEAFLREAYQRHAIIYKTYGKDEYVLASGRSNYEKKLLKIRKDQRFGYGAMFVQSPASSNDILITSKRVLKEAEIVPIASNRKIQSVQYTNWKAYVPTELHTTKTAQEQADSLQLMHSIEVVNDYSKIIPVVVKRVSEEHIVLTGLPQGKDENNVLDDNVSAGQNDEFLAIVTKKNLNPEDEYYISEFNTPYLPELVRKNRWRIHKVNKEERAVELERVSREYVPESKLKEGSLIYLRSTGHHGQLQLRRRIHGYLTRARYHSYLHHCLGAPANAIQEMSQPQRNKAVLCESLKTSQEGIVDTKPVRNLIVATQPLFAIQGPPGTGKTFLVSELIADILAKEPGSRVLVSAQSKAALQALTEKIIQKKRRDSSFRPIVVQIGNIANKADEDARIGTAYEILENVCKALEDKAAISNVQADWKVLAKNILQGVLLKLPVEENEETTIKDTGIVHDLLDDELNLFGSLVQSSADIVVCTSTSSRLERLAQEQKVFDWTIIEEAARAHGTELVLPLLAGLRWVFVGDHHQLPPFDEERIIEKLDNLDQSLEEVATLPWQWEGGFFDRSFAKYLQELSDEETQSLAIRSQARLRAFEFIFKQLEEGLQGSEFVAAYVQKTQFRMRKSIGELVQSVFYPTVKFEYFKTVENYKTPLNISNTIVLPEDSGIYWVNVPYYDYDIKYGESRVGFFEGGLGNEGEANIVCELLKALYPNVDEEVDLVVMTPYAKQCEYLQKKIEELDELGSVHEQIRFHKMDDKTKERKRYAYTVDSFQGHEADVAIISLVRNNNGIPTSDADTVRGVFGFNIGSERANVLMSRAAKQIIFVGSWQMWKCKMALAVTDTVLMESYSSDKKGAVSWDSALRYISQNGRCFEFRENGFVGRNFQELEC